MTYKDKLEIAKEVTRKIDLIETLENELENDVDRLFKGEGTSVLKFSEIGVFTRFKEGKAVHIKFNSSV